MVAIFGVMVSPLRVVVARQRNMGTTRPCVITTSITVVSCAAHSDDRSGRKERHRVGEAERVDEVSQPLALEGDIVDQAQGVNRGPVVPTNLGDGVDLSKLIGDLDQDQLGTRGGIDQGDDVGLVTLIGDNLNNRINQAKTIGDRDLTTR